LLEAVTLIHASRDRATGTAPSRTTCISQRPHEGDKPALRDVYRRADGNLVEALNLYMQRTAICP
jgi:hypothetical protein